jgi:hypothetical protein
MLRSTTVPRALPQEGEWVMFESQTGKLRLPNKRQDGDNTLLTTLKCCVFEARESRLFKG